jgi:hypothetical protein
MMFAPLEGWRHAGSPTATRLPIMLIFSRTYPTWPTRYERQLSVSDLAIAKLE